MRFAFTLDQLAFRDAAKALFASECPPAVVRSSWESATGLNPGLWGRLGEMGVLGLLVPEASGGLGLSMIDMVLIVEEAGYAGLPDPLVEHAVVAAPLLARIEPDGRLLVDAVNGANVIAVAGFDRSEYVVHAEHASAMLACGVDGIRLTRPIAKPVRLATVDAALRLYELGDPGARSGAGPRAGLSGDAAVAAAGSAFNRGALGTAAFLIGAARRCLDLTVGYISERQQFGVPVGSFQGLKHQLATALMQLEFSRPAVYRAAQSITDAASGSDRDVSMAKAMASDAAKLVARTSLQAHGAIGYTVEYDLHLWFKRIFALAPTWGDSAWHTDRVGRALGI
jgi:alkylation response protein AidB-like acyl-CoA dehydrogenase